MFIRVLAVVWLAEAALNASTPPRFRLGDDVQPQRYRATLTITPGEDSFHGVVDIDVQVRNAGSELWLNASGIEVQKAELRSGSKTLDAHAEASSGNFVGLTFAQPVPAGDARLHIEYTGKISSHSSAGVFQLKEADRWYVYTQFEPTDARRAFPCFDEPGFKVPWEITLNVPDGQRAFANTPEVSETPEAAGRKLVKFATTRPLPSYLVAFAVGPFDIADAGAAGTKHTPLRVITPHGKASEAKFAVAAVPQLLDLLERYFGIPYPYEKLDSIVMPISNFAMENVGLITYGESLLLADPKNDTLTRQREMAIVAAHEMAHQWFGDLVTTAWWNDTWLNEGFATWMETKIVNEWKPEWHIDVNAVEDRLEAQRLDSLVSARKVRQPILSESDIANAFDDITYKKGAAVLHMFESWIGPETFRGGVQLYLKRHEDGNATTDDFLAAIGRAAHKDIAPAFNTFLDQPGVPLVTVTADCRDKVPRFHLAQKRYLPLGSPGLEKEATSPTRWQIPVCVRYGIAGKSQTQCWLLDSESKEVALPAGAGCPAWMASNAGGEGYYYSSQPALDEAADHLSTPELVSALGDVLAGVEGGSTPPRLALALVPKFAGDARRQVVAEDIDVAHLVQGRFMTAGTRASAAAFVDSIFGERARTLGWTPRKQDSDDTRLLRHELVRFAAAEGEDKSLIEQAQSLAKRWPEDRKAIEPGMLGDVLAVAAEHGDRGLFEKFHAALASTHVRRERAALFRALGSFRDPAIARSALALLLTSEFDAREAFRPILFGPLQYPETRDLPFQFVKENLDKLLARLPREVGEDFAADLPETGNAFCDASHRQDVDNFFRDRVKNYVGGARVLEHTLENIDICIAQRKLVAPQISQYLDAQ